MKTIFTSKNPDFPKSAVAATTDQILIADGVSKMRTWDGLSDQATNAGVPAPSSKVVGAGSSPSNTTSFSQTLSSNQGGLANFSLRTVISNSLISASGSKVTVTLKGGSPEGIKLDAVYIGHRSGLYNFDGNQRQLTFSGSGSVTISSGSTATSDEVTFDLDETKDLIISFDVSNDASKDTSATATSVSGYSTYYNVSADAAQVTNPTGTWIHTSAIGFLVQTVTVITSSLTLDSVYAYLRYVDQNGNVGNPSPVSDAISITSQQLNYSNVEVPGDSKVVRKQIFRTLSGNANVAYLDIDTESLSTTTFTSRDDDDTISLREALLLSDDSGNTFLDQYGIPPNDKSFLCVHKGRVFAVGDPVYSKGHVSLTNASTAVEGLGTRWTESMEGRSILFSGETDSYTVFQVTSETSLVLSSAYTGSTAAYKNYSIIPAPESRRAIRWSQVNLPEAWAELESLIIPDTGDYITGILSQGPFIYITESSKIHRFEYGNNPEDGSIQVIAYHGCLNNRCWVIAESGAIYFLDFNGVHVMNGRESSEVSAQIRDMFQGGGRYRIDFSPEAIRYTHGVYCRKDNLIKWFVRLVGVGCPTTAIVLHLDTGRWSIDLYHAGVSGSIDALPDQVFACMGDGTIVRMECGESDGNCAAVTGLGTGKVTSATVCSLTNNTIANFCGNSLNRHVVITRGRGKRQVRKVVKVDGNTLYIDRPWQTLPDSTSEYMLGAVNWEYRSGMFSFPPYDSQNRRDVVVSYVPNKGVSTMNIRIYPDYDEELEPYETSIESGNVTITAGEDSAEVDLASRVGQALLSVDSRLSDSYSSLNNRVSVALDGSTIKERTVVNEVDLLGAEE